MQFNYAEMAMCIAPRPFMVERGHDDGVGLDHWVGWEFAKVRRGYTKLGLQQQKQQHQPGGSDVSRRVQ